MVGQQKKYSNWRENKKRAVDEKQGAVPDHVPFNQPHSLSKHGMVLREGLKLELDGKHCEVGRQD